MNTLDQNNRNAGLILIGLGILFVLSQIFSFSWMAMLWPLFVIIPGLPFLYGAYNDESGKNSGLIFPGLIIAGTGLILLYQNLTGHWESWAYIWTLYPVFVGMGLQFHGGRTGDRQEVKTGRGMVRYGLMALAGLAFLFEFLIFGSVFSGLSGLLWPLGLLGAGFYLLNRNRRESPRKRKVEFAEKPKHVYSGPSAEISPDLRRRIEEALAEDDETVTSNGGASKD